MGLQTRFFYAPTETPSRPWNIPGFNRIAVGIDLTGLNMSLSGRPAGERKAAAVRWTSLASQFRRRGKPAGHAFKNLGRGPNGG